MTSKKFKLLVLKTWETLFGITGGLVLAGILLFYKLGSLVPTFGPSEYSQLRESSAISFANPLNAPLRFGQWLLIHTGHAGPFAARSISALVGIGAIMLFYYVVSRWTNSNYLVIMATALFATSSWFLHYARLATPDIFLLSLLAALAYGTWLRKTQRPLLVFIFGFLIAVCLLYFPGLVWFVVIGGIWQRRALFNHLTDVKFAIVPIIAVLGLLMLPLLIAFVRQPDLIRVWLGFPSTWATPYDLFRHIINVPFQILFRGPDSPEVWLGRLPLLDLFSSAMAVIGAYAYTQKRGLDRARLTAGALVLGGLLVGIRGSVSSIILLPFVYLLVAAGIAYMLKEWQTVFPLNPLAKVIAIVLISVAVGFSCYQNLQHYFVAWPNSPQTKKVFRLSPGS